MKSAALLFALPIVEVDRKVAEYLTNVNQLNSAAVEIELFKRRCIGPAHRIPIDGSYDLLWTSFCVRITLSVVQRVV